jgi:hypothetical protein
MGMTFHIWKGWALAGCLVFSMPSAAQTIDKAGPSDEKATIPKSKTPMMDILVLEVLKGEPINETQAKQVINQEFGKIWNNKDPYPVDPADSKEVRHAKHQVWTYLAAIKASFLDPENHMGWPVGYGALRKEGLPRLMLDQLKSLAAAPQDKLNRTMIHYAMITPAWIVDDKEATAAATQQLAKDWPGDSVIVEAADGLKQWAKQTYPRKKE